MTDNNSKSGPACPSDEFLGRSDNDDTNELRNIIAKQPLEQTNAASRPQDDVTAHPGPDAGRSAASVPGLTGNGPAAYGLGQAVTAGRAAAGGDARAAAFHGPDSGPSAAGAAGACAGSSGGLAGGVSGGLDDRLSDSLPGADAEQPEASVRRRNQAGQPDQTVQTDRPGRSDQNNAPNSRWGRVVYGGASDGPPWGGPGPEQPGGGNVPPGGAWVWLPQGVEQKKPWRKRHPILFWGGVILALALVFGWGRMSGEGSLLGGPKIAIINVDGIILDADDIVAFMDKVRKDGGYKGAILRINSPGGAVGPSQEIYQAAKRLGAQKPLVASMGALAASGGYYAALGADTILAGPSTLTASIGVKMQIPNIEELMRTIGISETTLATGALKDAGSSWREMSPEEEAYFMALLNDMYDEFIETVAKERDMTLDEVLAVADGRAMTGRQALAAGLVDGMGDRQDALHMVKDMAGLAMEKVTVVSGPEKPGSYLSGLLKSAMCGVLEERASMEQPRFFY